MTGLQAKIYTQVNTKIQGQFYLSSMAVLARSLRVIWEDDLLLGRSSPSPSLPALRWSTVASWVMLVLLLLISLLIGWTLPPTGQGAVKLGSWLAPAAGAGPSMMLLPLRLLLVAPLLPLALSLPVLWLPSLPPPPVLEVAPVVLTAPARPALPPQFPLS